MNNNILKIAVKISEKMHVINFPSLKTMLNIFNAVEQGQSRVGHPHSQLMLLSLFFIDKNAIYLDAECLYTTTFQTSTPLSPHRKARVKRAWKSYRWWGASAEQQWTAVRWDVVRSYGSKNTFSLSVCCNTVPVTCALRLHALYIISC